VTFDTESMIFSLSDAKSVSKLDGHNENPGKDTWPIVAASACFGGFSAGDRHCPNGAISASSENPLIGKPIKTHERLPRG
jgi:hypothetical protein